MAMGILVLQKNLNKSSIKGTFIFALRDNNIGNNGIGHM